MTLNEKFQYLRERMLPVLSEAGVSGFVLIGYTEDENGKMKRVCICNTANDPLIEDALRSAISFASMWAAPPSEFMPPPTNSKPDGQTP